MPNEMILVDGKQIMLPSPKHEGFVGLLKTAPRLPDYAPTTADRVQLIAAVLAEANKPLLSACTQLSIAKTAFNCVTLGLVPGDMLGMAHFVPFRDRKKNISECQLIVGYKGWLDLAYDGDFLLDVHSEVVLKGEEFSRWNDEAGIHVRHILPLDRDGNLSWPNVEAAYCVWHSRGGGRGMELVGRKALEALHRRGNVWETNTIAMCLKTPILRASKTWKRTRRMAMASALDDATEMDVSQPALCDMGEQIAEQPPALSAFTDQPERQPGDDDETLFPDD